MEPSANSGQNVDYPYGDEDVPKTDLPRSRAEATYQIPEEMPCRDKSI